MPYHVSAPVPIATTPNASTHTQQEDDGEQEPIIHDLYNKTSPIVPLHQRACKRTISLPVCVGPGIHNTKVVISNDLPSIPIGAG